MPFRAITSARKIMFRSLFSSVFKCFLCSNRDLSDPGFNTSVGAQQMFMQKKGMFCPYNIRISYTPKESSKEITIKKKEKKKRKTCQNQNQPFVVNSFCSNRNHYACFCCCFHDKKNSTRPSSCEQLATR